MGNVSGKNEGEGTSSSGVKYGGEEGMEFAVHGRAAPISYHHSQGVYAEAEPMVHSPPHNPGGYLQPPLFAPQVFSFPFYLFIYYFSISWLPNYCYYFVVGELNKYFSN